MFDDVFGELEFDYGLVGKKNIEFFGQEQEIEVRIEVEEDDSIQQVQYDAFSFFMEHWDEIQHKIAVAIAKYYNEEEKGSYGPDDPEEYKQWWPDVDNEEDVVKLIHLDSIVIRADYIMENDGENSVYVLFNRDWGGEDYDDNGVAVLVVDGEVTSVGYKDIAF